MQTTFPDEAAELARKRATAFEQCGEIDPDPYVSTTIAEVEAVLTHPSVDRDRYLATIRGKAKIEMASLDPSIYPARYAFFTEYLQKLSALDGQS